MCVLYRYHNDMTDCAVARIAGHDRWQWAGNGVAWCMLRQHAGTGVVSLQQLAVAGARWRPVWRGTADAWRCIAPSRPISIRRPVPGDASRHPIPCHGWLGGMQRGVWRHGRSVHHRHHVIDEPQISPARCIAAGLSSRSSLLRRPSRTVACTPPPDPQTHPLAAVFRLRSSASARRFRPLPPPGRRCRALSASRPLRACRPADSCWPFSSQQAGPPHPGRG
jgi:hypothetical protein